MLRVFGGIAAVLVVIALLLHLTGAAPWLPKPVATSQEVRTPAPAATATPSGMLVQTPAKATAVPKQAVGATRGVTTTVTTLTRVTTTVWAQECELDSGKPECNWVIRETRTETEVGDKPSVSVPCATVTATPTPAPTATPKPVAKAPAPYAVPPVSVKQPAAPPSYTPPPAAAPEELAPAPQPSAPSTTPAPAATELEREYNETGVGLTRPWTLSVPPDRVLVVGGYRVNDRKPGVYKAYGGGQTVTINVTDGFYSIVKAEKGPGEFCFRVGQARQMGQALSVMEPLPGWPAC